MSTGKLQLAQKSEIFQYAFGGLGSNIFFYIQLSFLMYFYTDVFKVSPVAVGSLFLGVRLLDAIFDPIMGMLTDRTRTKWGSFRPYLIFGAPLLAAVMILMFTAPNLSPTGKIVYAALTYLCYSFMSSVVNIPYHSLTAVMSKDPNQTTTITMAKQFMLVPAGLIVNAGVLPMVAFFGTGQQGWFVTVFILTIIASLSFWICANGVKRHDMTADRKSTQHQHPPIKKQLSLIVQNKPLLILMLSFFMNLTATTTNGAVSLYFWKYNVNHMELYSQISLWGTILSLPIYAFTPYLARKIGKRNVFLYGSLAAAVPTLIMMLIPTDNVTVILIATILKQVLGTFCGSIVWALIPDCVQYGNWKTGVEGAGTVTSACTFVNKLGSALGGSLTGAILGAVGYVAGQVQSPEVLKVILYLYAGVPLVAYIGTAIALRYFKIPQEVFQNSSTKKEHSTTAELHA